MEVLDKDRIQLRFSVLENLEYYIKESVYYRAFAEEISYKDKYVLYVYGEEEGHVTIK